MRNARIVFGVALVLALALVMARGEQVSAQTPSCGISASVGNSPGYDAPIVSSVDARLVCPGPAPDGWMTVIWRAGGRTAVCSAPTTGGAGNCQSAIQSVGDEMSITVMFEAGGRIYSETISAPGNTKQGGTYIRSAPPKRLGRIKITHVYPIGIGGPQPDEWIQFENMEEFPIDMSGWVLKTQANEQAYVFGDFVIGPGGRCRIYTNTNDSTWCNLNWNSGWEIWGDKRDVGVLFNYLGDEVSRITYNEGSVLLEWRWVETQTITIPGSQFGAPSSQSTSSSSGSLTPTGTSGTTSGGTTPGGSTGNPTGSNLINLPF